MRGIRNDLQERANLCEEQIRAAYAHLEKMIQQLQSERDMRIADLKAGLATIERLMAFEESLMGNVVMLESPQGPRPSIADRITAASG
jgi:hypothetical protein